MVHIFSMQYTVKARLWSNIFTSIGKYGDNLAWRQSDKLFAVTHINHRLSFSLSQFFSSSVLVAVSLLFALMLSSIRQRCDNPITSQALFYLVPDATALLTKCTWFCLSVSEISCPFFFQIGIEFLPNTSNATAFSKAFSFLCNARSNVLIRL